MIVTIPWKLQQVAIVAILFSVWGCHRPMNQPTGPDELQSLIGRNVHLKGRFGGPGKLADYVVVTGEEIYLMGIIDSGGRRLQYGSIVTVDGVLGYRSYPSIAPADVNPLAARPLDHFYIENPKVCVLPLLR